MTNVASRTRSLQADADTFYLILLSLQVVPICQRFRLFHSSNMNAITSHVDQAQSNQVTVILSFCVRMLQL